MKRPWLLPLVPLYAAGLGLRSAGLRLGMERVQRLVWPVISVGSISAGGAGKTPFVIALAKLLERSGTKVDVLSRGYGRAGSGPARVRLDGDAAIYGDEPLLIAKEANVSVFVDSRRYVVGKLAEAPGAESTVHLLDDGFQHRQLARDVDIALVSSEDLKDSLLPAGDLREPVSGLRRAMVLAVPVGDEAATVELERRGLGPAAGQQIWRFRREMAVSKAEGPVVAFCGIARPGQFFAGLERLDIEIAVQQAFRDHHRFSEQDLEMLADAAKRTGAKAFMTTGKDRMRLGSVAERLTSVAPLLTADLRVEFEDEAGVVEWIGGRLQASGGRSL